MTRLLKTLPLCLSLGVLTLAGCTDDTTPAESATETGDPTSTTGDGDGDATGDGDGDDPAGDGDGDAATCGDGTVDDGEACDDGNVEDGDGCSSTCAISSCGLVWAVTEDVPSSTAGGFDVEVGADGSIYAAGIAVNADNDGWVAKWNADGTLAWSESFDSGNGNDVAAGIALGAGGEVYVAGWQAGDGDDLWYAALDGSTGAEQWSQVVAGDVVGEDDLATGIDVDGNGDLILTGRVRVGDGDDDIWVRKASASDGAEIWTSLWSGTGDGNFSTDRGGQVAAAADGTYWVTGREHIDFDSQEATLLHFNADGTLAASYQPQAGGNHQHDVIDVVVGADAVYFAMEESDFPYHGWLYKLGFDGSEQWVKTELDFLLTVGEETVGNDWRVRGLGLDSDGNLGIGGVFDNEEDGEDINWGEAWTAKLDGAGEYACRSRHMVTDESFIPPSLFVDGAGFSDGGFGLTAIETAGQGNATKLWTGFFMP